MTASVTKSTVWPVLMGWDAVVSLWLENKHVPVRPRSVHLSTTSGVPLC